MSCFCSKYTSYSNILRVSSRPKINLKVRSFVLFWAGGISNKFYAISNVVHLWPAMQNGLINWQMLFFFCIRHFLLDNHQRLKICFAVHSFAPVVNCTASGDLLHGYVSTNTTSFNQVITYNCNTGYGINGGAKKATDLRCQADGTWNGASPRCTGTAWSAWHVCSMQCPILY